MDTSENVVFGRSKEFDSPGSQFEDNHGSKESETTPDALPVQSPNVQQNFQDTLRAIDLELAKFDGDVGKDFQLRAEEGSGCLLSTSEGIMKLGAGESDIEIVETNCVFSAQ
nr:hypothetical protein CFP56_33397 [Quercus suber]